ncbi:MAG: hypothetical protein ACR2OX_03385 [Methyloligellaceae bacterium]
MQETEQYFDEPQLNERLIAGSGPITHSPIDFINPFIASPYLGVDGPMRKTTKLALAGAALSVSIVLAGAVPSASAQSQSFASLTTPNPDAAGRTVALELKCRIEASSDGGSRVVIMNTLKRVVQKGSIYRYTIMGFSGVQYSRFEGQIPSDLAPNGRLLDDFQQEIVACRAVVFLAK